MKQSSRISPEVKQEIRALNEEQKQAKAILLATKWVEANRSDLVPYLSKYSKAQSRKDPTGTRYFVGLAIDGPRGLEHYSFWADLETEALELLPWLR